MDTTAPVSANAHFNRQYQTHLKHLKLKGLQPKTIDAYARAIRRIGDYFDHNVDTLSESQLTDYFSDLIASHSWSAVKLDLYGLKFYTVHVLRKPWVMPHLIKPPKVARLPDIVTAPGGAGPVRRHPHLELPRVLLRPVQPWPAPERGPGLEGQRH